MEGGRVFLRSPPRSPRLGAEAGRRAGCIRLSPGSLILRHAPSSAGIRKGPQHHRKAWPMPSSWHRKRSGADAPQCCPIPEKMSGRHVPGRAAGRFQPPPAAGKVFRSCRERTPHPGFFQTRPVIRDFINKYKQNIFFSPHVFLLRCSFQTKTRRFSRAIQYMCAILFLFEHCHVFRVPDAGTSYAASLAGACRGKRCRTFHAPRPP